MKEGDIILTLIPQADGRVKNRSAVVLRQMPGYGDVLVCGVSTQLQHDVQNFDDIISPTEADFASSGLVSPSVIRLGFFAVLPKRDIAGPIGTIASERRSRLLKALSTYLLQPLKQE